MRKISIYYLVFILIGISCSTGNNSKGLQNNTVVAEKSPPLIAKHYYSGFELAHDTYNTISVGSDERIYYCLSSRSIDIGGQLYAYNPARDKISHLGDLTAICGEADTKAIPQGKCHSDFYEYKGKLYVSTHAGYYAMIDGMEMMVQTPPKGYKLYPGGHLISYDMTSGNFEDLAKIPNGDAFVTMTMDTIRGQIYGISWPRGYFFHYDVEKRKLKNLGQISGNGEAGKPGKDYRVLCRSIVVDPRDGTAYLSTSEGNILSYNPAFPEIKKVEGVNLRLDYFGEYDSTRPGSMQYNWRRITWAPDENVAYGVHGNSGYLFTFDPKEKKVEIVDRITSEPSKKSGVFDLFSYGYLGFELGPDKETLYYLTGGPIYIDGKRVKGVDVIAMGAAKGLENLHLITYNIPTNNYIDHGPVFYEDGSRPTYVNSIAVGKDGHVYTLARFIHDGKEIEDLVKIPDPLFTEQLKTNTQF